MVPPHADPPLPRPVAAARAIALAVLAAVPLALLLAGLAGAVAVVDQLATWGTAAAFASGALVCTLRARTLAADRAAWTWLAAACGLWASANTYYALVLAPGPAPIPSPLDVGYALFPVAVFAGLVAVVRARRPLSGADVWLDGLIAVLAMAAAAAVGIFRLVDADAGALPAVVTTLVYPLEDVILLGALIGASALLGQRLGREWLLVGAGVLCILAADTVVFSRVLQGSSVGGAWTNALWSGGIALFALAATRRPSAVPSGTATDAEGARAGAGLHLTVGSTAVALLVLATDGVLGLPLEASILAGLATLVACVRLHRSFAEVRALAGSRRQALTDDLTGLPNRRHLLADLEDACADPAGHGLLALFDLDGFKRFNDTFGHTAGDALLRELADALRRAVHPDGVAYRLGGDEFCVLTRDDAAGRVRVGAAAAALSARGPGWTVDASFGVVALRHEATDAAEALGVADRRMYAQKDRRPAAARQQARDVLLSALGEQQPDLREHAHDVTALAGAVATALGMGPDEVDDVVRAAELHDVGKLAIPREILDKPGALEAAEWEVMRRHTEIGERLLLAAPALAAIAPLVRSSHERWDGGGYPDGLAGNAIPLGARIVAVCDAFDAIVTDRPYRAGQTVADALAELRASAGTHFDPAVVAAFVTVLDTGARAAQAPGPDGVLSAGGAA